MEILESFEQIADSVVVNANIFKDASGKIKTAFHNNDSIALRAIIAGDDIFADTKTISDI